MKKFLIVDGSSIFYRAFYAMPALTAPTGEPTGALAGTANILLKALHEFKPDFAAVALDAAKKTFRNEMFDGYKATRQSMPDDLAAQLALLKEFIGALGIKTCAAHGYEADDVIGTLSSQAENFSTYILTGDRDALQLIDSTTRVLLTKTSGVAVYDEQKFRDEYGFPPANLVDFKSLRGDTSDNIPGVKGVGDKTAATLIRDFGTLENVLAHRDEIKQKKIRTALETFADDARLSKQLAQIVRDVPDVVFDAKSFAVTPDLTRLDEFCNRYALNQAKKKIHDLFDRPTLFDEPKIRPVIKVLPFDEKKNFAAESLSVARNESNSLAVKVSGGEVFSATRDDVQKVFSNFAGKIVLRDLKTFLHEFDVADTQKFFDVELAAYLLYPERDKASRDAELDIDDGLAAEVTALEHAAALYERLLS